jgi:hypothetical protein
MPVCDGPTCNRDIPWRITKTALQMQASNVAFSVDQAHVALLTVLSAAKCWNLKPEKRDVVFKNLCKACWDQQAATWGDVATYTLARAKTVKEAIYMQVERADFQVAGAFSSEAILSCTIHEMMHYWSYEGAGIQNYNRRANVDWDEAVADVLGFRVYKTLYHAQPNFTNYITPYNTYCQCFKRADTQFSNVFGRHWREEADRRRLPSPVCDFITAGKTKNVPMINVKSPASALLVKTLSEYLFTWFFLGPQQPILDGKTTVRIDQFLEQGNMQNMFAVTNVFQSYDGNNTLHAIG